MNPDSPSQINPDDAAQAEVSAPDPTVETSDTTRPSLRERFREAARIELLDAAERVLSREGVQGARIDAIAAEAGVSVGTVYNVFGDREGLVAAVLERRRDATHDLIRKTLDTMPDRPFEERFARMAHMLFDHFQRNWPYMRLVSQLSPAPGCPPTAAGPKLSRDVVLEIHGMLRELIGQGVVSGALRPLDLHAAASALMGMIRATVEIDLATDQDAPTRERADFLIRLYLRGAGA